MVQPFRPVNCICQPPRAGVLKRRVEYQVAASLRRFCGQAYESQHRKGEQESASHSKYILLFYGEILLLIGAYPKIKTTDTNINVISG